ncbi:hypothetical protein JX265_013994 [Neoarthrinium moseri]|uniref:Xylanolytic transcriptional activator regulatory domain-containing protein n=1 Tax=Neoarthrinium moseri TaxID=1658444 RepID=A0A9P9W7F8_9PEZI|nr:hypothetical protein JX265_013994 [Neoarthrinium moseri]
MGLTDMGAETKYPAELAVTDDMRSLNDVTVGTQITRDWSVDEEKRVVRKLDCILMPLLVLGFFSLQLDRSNISNALTSAIREDLSITTVEVNSGNQLQLAGILVTEIPANLLLQKVGTSAWLTAQCVSWGLVGVFQAFITDKSSFYATRFLLGVFEAGYIPGCQLLLSLFYKREELALRTAVFYFGNYFSAGSGSLIASGALQMAGLHGLSGWRWLFIIDGSCTLIMAIAFFLLLPASPLVTLPLCRVRKLNLFTEAERHVMHNRIVLEDPDKGTSFRSFKMHDIIAALCDYTLWGHFAINMLSLAPKGGLQLYSPTIIKGLNFSTTQANALASISNYGVCVLSFLVSWGSDWRRVRGAWCIVACAWSMVFAGALYGLPLTADRWATFAMFTLLNSGNGVSQGLNDAWLNSNAKSHLKRSIGLALAVIGSNLGGLAGQQLFQDNDAPRYSRAFIAVLCLYGAAVVMTLLQMGMYGRLNKRLASMESQEECVEGYDERADGLRAKDVRNERSALCQEYIGFLDLNVQIRCSRTSPCVNCTLALAECEYRNDGSKRLPVSREYVASLESRVAKLETFLAQLKKVPRDERNLLIDSIDFLDDSAEYANSVDWQGKQTTTSPNNPKAALLRREEAGSVTYHGPTSIYNSALAVPNHGSRYISYLPLPLVHPLDTGEGVTAECISLFFHWQYPQFMFIDREAFILDYQRRSFDSQFCSSALVNAVCSVGALMSSKPDVKQRARLFAQTAVELVMSHGIATSHTTTVQTLLCSAFFEIGAGNISKGWLLSGMAFRMGQDLGFQRDPETWKDGSADERSAIKEYRRRIYWGCYVSDKFFSLMLGRPCMMHESDGDVKSSKPQQQDPIFNNWAEGHGLTHLMDELPVTPRLADVFNKQVEVSRIVRQGLNAIHSSRQAPDWADVAINEIVTRLVRFKDQLPPLMRLREWMSFSEPVQPHLAALHMLWHSSRISLICPFLNVSNLQRSRLGSVAAVDLGEACVESVERIIVILRRFESQHGLRHAPILFVHGAIAAANTILTLARCESKSPDRPHFAELELALQEMSATWDIAGHALTKLRELISTFDKDLVWWYSETDQMEWLDRLLSGPI